MSPDANDLLIEDWASPLGATWSRLGGGSCGVAYQVDLQGRDLVVKIGKTLESVSLEYDALIQLSAALRETPDISCPEPLGLLPQLPGYAMTRVTGIQLDSFVIRRRALDPELAMRVLYAVRAFHAVASVPYGDFHPRNVLVDADGSIALIDPSISDPFFGQPSGLAASPMELDLGYWLYASVAREWRTLLLNPLNLYRRLAFLRVLIRVARCELGLRTVVGALTIAGAHFRRLEDEGLRGAAIAVLTQRLFLRWVTRGLGTSLVFQG